MTNIHEDSLTVNQIYNQSFSYFIFTRAEMKEKIRTTKETIYLVVGDLKRKKTQQHLMCLEEWYPA